MLTVAVSLVGFLVACVVGPVYPVAVSVMGISTSFSD